MWGHQGTETRSVHCACTINDEEAFLSFEKNCDRGLPRHKFYFLSVHSFTFIMLVHEKKEEEAAARVRASPWGLCVKEFY